MDEKLLDNVSNSHKVRDGDAKEKPVERPKFKGQVKAKKKNGIVKFAEAFLPEDVTDVKGYILTEVVIPSFKKILDDVFHVILYGNTERSSSSRSAPRVSYQNYFDRKRSDSPSRRSREESVYILEDDFIFEYREDAENFVYWMEDMIAEAGFVRLSEANEYIGRSGYYTDTHYGWKSLNGWRVINTGRADGRYVLRLPRPFPID